MKKLAITLILILTTTAAFARPPRNPRPPQDAGYFISVQSVAYTAAFVTVDISATTTNNSYDRLEAARRIQNDVISYTQADGGMSLYLAEKVQALRAVHPELSEEESIDALLLASETILAE